MVLLQISTINALLFAVPETVALLIFSAGLLLMAFLGRRLLRRRESEVKIGNTLES